MGSSQNPRIHAFFLENGNLTLRSGNGVASREFREESASKTSTSHEPTQALHNRRSALESFLQFTLDCSSKDRPVPYLLMRPADEDSIATIRKNAIAAGGFRVKEDPS
jgi:hypothetical protein